MKLKDELIVWRLVTGFLAFCAAACFFIEIPSTHQIMRQYEEERKIVIYSQHEMRDYMLLLIQQNNDKLKPSAFKAKVKAK